MTDTTTPKPLTLRQRIVSIACAEQFKGTHQQTYRQGHRDALQAAAKLVEASTTREAMTAAVDAAMVEMVNISPRLKRSECERLIWAALSQYPILRAQAAGVVPVARITVNNNRNQIDELDVLRRLPRGITDLYASASPAHVPADVDAASPDDMVVYDGIAAGYTRDAQPSISAAEVINAIESWKTARMRIPNFADVEVLVALKMARAELDALPKSLGYSFTHLAAIDQVIARAETQHPTPEPAQAVDAVQVADEFFNERLAELGSLSPEATEVHAKLRAALAARQPQAQLGGGEDTFWLIELFDKAGNSTNRYQWLGERFTPDFNVAKKYQSKDDAEAVIKKLAPSEGYEWRAIEHGHIHLATKEQRS